MIQEQAQRVEPLCLLCVFGNLLGEAVLGCADCRIIGEHLELVAACLCQYIHNHGGGVDIPGGHGTAGAGQMLDSGTFLDLDGQFLVCQILFHFSSAKSTFAPSTI